MGDGAESQNKPCGTPELSERRFRCAVRRESEANLKVVRFGAEAPVGLLRKISHAEHRNLLKEGFGAKIVKSILFAMKRQDWYGLLKN